MEIIKSLFAENFPAAFATVCLAGYFFGMAIVFILKPVKNAESFSIKPVDNAGKTEIRVYYGGISFALGAFLLYLAFATGTAYYSLVGGMFFATTVFVTRTIFLFVDKGWKCPYTKLAIPAEGCFVIALWTCWFFAK
ncbi:MAG: hypothetical protein IJ491_08245 [Clostridia bacterium]|nr:hypothetical protein [Clostridia bacterium]